MFLRILHMSIPACAYAVLDQKPPDSSGQSPKRIPTNTLRIGPQPNSDVLQPSYDGLRLN